VKNIGKSQVSWKYSANQYMTLYEEMLQVGEDSIHPTLIEV
jgi:hypothetical protein